jgi:putative DNA primase/helicase
MLSVVNAKYQNDYKILLEFNDSKNGIVDLITGELRCSNRSDLITKRAHVTHSIDAKCPRWLKFINEIMDNDKELVDYLQKIVGYSLTGNTTEQKFFFLHGFGANGKSVLLKLYQIC